MTASRGLVLLAAVVAAVATARLGLWQLDRAEEKLRLQTLIDRRATMPPLPATELAREPALAEAQHYRRVRIGGRWLHAHTVHLDNRALGGRPGFIVVTPLQLAAGDAVLVQRGWMPRDASDRKRLQPLPATADEVVVEGRVAPAPSKLLELGDEPAGPIRQNLDLAAYSREIGQSLRPLSIQQLDAPGGSSDGLQRQWLAPTLDAGKNHGYAFQWFALSALIIGLYAWFQLIRPRHVRPR
jgi:surfeit locus 1 family protein